MCHVRQDGEIHMGCREHQGSPAQTQALGTGALSHLPDLSV